MRSPKINLNNSPITNPNGFTLMELIIVMAAVAALSAIMMSVINPGRQRSRAQDANTKAFISKAALASQAYVESHGFAPNGAQFLAGLRNACAGGSLLPSGACNPPAGSSIIGCTSAYSHCLFELVGNPLPSGTGQGCTTNLWNGSGVGQCYFRYERVGAATSTQFRVYAKSFGLNNIVFQFDSAAGTIEECSATSVPC